MLEICIVYIIIHQQTIHSIRLFGFLCSKHYIIYYMIRCSHPSFEGTYPSRCFRTLIRTSSNHVIYYCHYPFDNRTVNDSLHSCTSCRRPVRCAHCSLCSHSHDFVARAFFAGNLKKNNKLIFKKLLALKEQIELLELLMLKSY